MTSATLYREGENLDALLAELDEQYPGQVRVVEVSYPRTGGLGGFFAKQRVGVEYVLTAPAPAATPHRVNASPATTRPRPRPKAPPETLAVDPFVELIAEAESQEGSYTNTRSAVALQSTGQSGTSNAEFAKLLLDMAAKKSASRRSGEATQHSATDLERASAERAGARRAEVIYDEPDVEAEVSLSKIDAQVSAPAKIHDLAAHDFGPTLSAPLFRTVTRTGEEIAPPSALSAKPKADVIAPPKTAGPKLAGLELRRKLAEVGVPLTAIPAEPRHPYAVVQELVAMLPAVDALPRQNGAVVVLAGPSRQIAPAAQHLIGKLRLRADNIWSTHTRLPGNLITDVWHAAEIAGKVRLGSEGPALCVVATDNEMADHGEVIGALRPDALWAHVDATRKPADTSKELARLGEPTGLVVTGAQHTSSPATVWELGVPIALLDDRPATDSAWAVLLLDKLAELADFGD